MKPQEKIKELEAEVFSLGNAMEDYKKSYERLKKALIEKRVPTGYCYVCGSEDNITIHHLDEINSKFRKPKVNGIISLCENCHKIVEDIVNKGKSRSLWKEEGRKKALKDVRALIEKKIEDKSGYRPFTDNKEAIKVLIEILGELK